MKAMKNVIKIAAALPMLALFLDYAVAMQKVEPAGTRRSLSIYSKESTIRSSQIIKARPAIRFLDKDVA